MIDQIVQEDKNWYALSTRSRAEKKIFLILTEKGIEAFLPLRKTIRQWSDRKKTVTIPLFSSYIFVYISDKEYLPCLQVNGVVRFVSFNGKAVAIPSPQIEAIKAYLDEGAPQYDNANIDLKAGVNIEITRGPMMGLSGVLLTLQGKHRVKVEIDCVGQSLIIDVPRTSLRQL
jgi:transcriptional antiterminator RfaH